MTRSSETASRLSLRTALATLKAEVYDLEFIGLCTIGIMVLLFGR